MNKFELSQNYSHVSNAFEKAIEKIDKIRNNEEIPLLSSSKKENDKLGGLLEGDKLVIAGRTGTGKTAFALKKVDDWSNPELNPEWSKNQLILFDSFEMKDWKLATRLLSSHTKSTVKELLNYQQRLQDEKFELIKQIKLRFQNRNIFISNTPLNVKKWKNNKLNIQQKYPKAKIINVVDHTRLMSFENEKKEEELITSLMNAAIDISNSTGQIFVFLSQMNRNIETNIKDRTQMGKNTPVSSDIFGSDGLFQGADIVYALHRPGMYNLIDFEGLPTGKSLEDPDLEDYLLLQCVLKQRDGWTGNIALKHDLARNTFEDYNINELF